MGKEPLTTRLDPDTFEEVEDYAGERDIGQTEATRRLIRGGLEAAEDTEDTEDDDEDAEDTEDITTRTHGMALDGTSTLILALTTFNTGLLGIAITTGGI
jgi:hypothetical protein